MGMPLSPGREQNKRCQRSLDTHRATGNANNGPVENRIEVACPIFTHRRKCRQEAAHQGHGAGNGIHGNLLPPKGIENCLENDQLH